MWLLQRKKGLPCRRISNNLCRFSTLKLENIISQSLGVNCVHSHFIPECSMERVRVGRVTLKWRSLTSPSSARWSRQSIINQQTSTTINHIHIMWWKQPWTSVALLPRIHSPGLSWENPSGKLQSWGILQSIWSVFLKSVLVINNRKSLRNCHSQEESKETWWWNIILCLK